jgi:hypothetical protein
MMVPAEVDRLIWPLCQNTVRPTTDLSNHFAFVDRLPIDQVGSGLYFGPHPDETYRGVQSQAIYWLRPPSTVSLPA